MAYIDKEKIRQAIEQLENDTDTIGILVGINRVGSAIANLPTADVVEVKHGEWRQGVPYVCSICGKPAPDEKNTSERYSCWTSPYCPHCGAKMDGERRDT